MIPILEEKICDKYGWMSSEEVLDCIAVSQSLPGVIAVNMATYVGYKKKGVIGAVITTFGDVYKRQDISGRGVKRHVPDAYHRHIHGVWLHGGRDRKQKRSRDNFPVHLKDAAGEA